jgi:hypothetical protein
MSNRKYAKAIQGLSHRIWRLYRKITKHLINVFLRFFLVFQRRGKVSTTGFILPTTVLLILVVALTAGALTFRAFTRNSQVLGEAQQRVIYNAATPAIDRARSKLEFMFDSARDNRLPAGVPSQDVMETMLRNDGKDRSGKDFPILTLSNGTSSTDPYTLPDERRIDINGDGRADNAWWFQTDTNANGRIDAGDSTIIYSMVLNTPPEERGANGSVKKIATRLLEMKDKDKANNLFVRQAPLSVQGALGCTTTTSSTNSVGPDGWFEDSSTTAVLRKNFQVDALVIPGSQSATKVTLEFNQDRQLNRGNKWGAWFRNDLEIHPGPPFNWNGAMHTEGSLIIGQSGSFTAYLISSPESCLYYPDSSEVTVTLKRPTPTTPDKDLIGLVTSGMVANGNQSGSSTFHLHHPTTPQNNTFWATLNSTTSSSSAGNPINISLDPEKVLIKDGYTNRQGTNNSNFVKPNKRDLPDFGKNQKLPQRIFNEEQTAPYVDDLYRADDRWGPKPSYDSDPTNQMGSSDRIGGQIPEARTKLLQLEPLPGDEEAVGVGLDGYWERRARMIGMRLLVGERLELGNLFTWYSPEDTNGDGFVFSTPGSDGVIDQNEYEHEGDPLYPPTVRPYPVAPNTGRLTHVDAQRRTLRDNLSAVQSTAIYHSAFANNSEERDYPVACLATTAHPGTLTTLRQSTLFRPFNFQGTDTSISGSLLTNFFTGVGTNGWEFDPPASNLGNFRTAITNPSSSLRLALQNLANFAGDYNASTGVGGAYPPTQEAQGSTVVHPYPALSMWGNFSNLKRALALLNSQGNDFNKLSVADKTYLQTAACNVGMLAYSIDQIQRFDPSNSANDTAMVSSSFAGQRLMAKLGRDLWMLMDGSNTQTGSIAPNSVTNPEVLSRQQMATYGYSATGTEDLRLYNAADYEKVPPEAFIGALRQYLLSAGNMKPNDRDFIDEMRLAELIMLNHQIRRDRTFGFQSSSAFGRYAFMVDGNTFRVLPTACDPDLFAFSSAPVDTLLSTNMGTDNRLSTTSTATTGLAIPTPDGTNLATVSASPASTTRSALARYRVGLSRLCGTIDIQSSNAVVLPKFPSLYYIFPEVDHDFDGNNDTSTGGANHSQPATEPYIADNYVRVINAQFKRISNTLAPGRAGAQSALFIASTPPTAITPGLLSRYPNGQRVFPIPDYSVRDVALLPRMPNGIDMGISAANAQSTTNWQLPFLNTPRPFVLNSPTSNDKANFSTNLIMVRNGDSLRPIAIPFLDRVFFQGRQLMATRTLDIDLGLLRSSGIGQREVWLPISGIVYAFREDSVREDGIARPVNSTGEMNVQNPTRPVDPPPVTDPTMPNKQISKKSLDQFPDPDRRIHGFRLRNGVQLMRNRQFEGTVMDAPKNSRGLSLFTDQPVYIQGDFNLHQTGADDTIGDRLEEFRDRLPDSSLYNATQFYTRKGRDERFASLNNDRWRPAEILADSISILSNNFCDGTIADTFVQMSSSVNSLTANTAYPVPDFSIYSNFGSPGSSRSYYHQPQRGLFDPGCTTTSVTSFHNQNRPVGVNMGAKTAGARNGWDWVRENSRSDATLPVRSNSYTSSYWVDFASPVKISRTGHPVVARPREDTLDTPPAIPRNATPIAPVVYNRNFTGATNPPFYDYGENGNGADNGRQLINSAQTRVNAIIVSGINPSRPNQGYGGLHNFPRFLESWSGVNLNFSGSFIQLSYTNYGTAPFELESWEPSLPPETDDPRTSNQNIPYYVPPNRLWGYDVALQFSPAGPAAARFVTLASNRNEFYVEPPADDPYIANLCKAAVAQIPNLKTNCPERN